MRVGFEDRDANDDWFTEGLGFDEEGPNVISTESKVIGCGNVDVRNIRKVAGSPKCADSASKNPRHRTASVRGVRSEREGMRM